MQKISITNLQSNRTNALPISELSSFAPTANSGKKILRSHLVVRTGTHELIQGMRDSLSQTYERSGLGSIVPFMEAPINHLTLATIQTGPFMAPDKAAVVMNALNSARQMLRGDKNDQKLALSFNQILLSVVDPANGGGKNAKPLLAGELR